jgi:hypothetical protein
MEASGVAIARDDNPQSNAIIMLRCSLTPVGIDLWYGGETMVKNLGE